MTDRETDADPAADGSNGGDSDAESDSAREVPWSDFDDGSERRIDIPPPSRNTPTQVIAGTTAFIQPAVYCEQCPQFDAVTGECANADTDILETLHDGRFHVIGCPAVTTDGPDFDRVQRD